MRRDHDAPAEVHQHLSGVAVELEDRAAWCPRRYLGMSPTDLVALMVLLLAIGARARPRGLSVAG